MSDLTPTAPADTHNWDIGFRHGIHWIHDLNCQMLDDADIPARSSLSREEFVGLLTAVGDGSDFSREYGGYSVNAFRVLMGWFDCTMRSTAPVDAPETDEQRVERCARILRRAMRRHHGFGDPDLGFDDLDITAQDRWLGAAALMLSEVDRLDRRAVLAAVDAETAERMRAGNRAIEAEAMELYLARFPDGDWSRLDMLVRESWLLDAWPRRCKRLEDEMVRLRAIEAAAREYAEARREWECGLEAIDTVIWHAIEYRHEAARAALLALFDGEGEG